MSIACLTLVRNEGSRWLPSLAHQWREYADEIIALDDNSNDNTADILTDAGATVVRRSDAQAAWGAESHARAELYRLGVQSDAEWLLWLDADMGFIRSPRNFLLNLPDVVDAVAFRLYDLWTWSGVLYYRDDAFWQAHRVPRVWCVRRSRCDPNAAFSDRGIHCGHLPALPIRRIAIAPQDMSILHYGYARAEDRRAKYAAYMSRAAQLTLSELQHAETIVADDARLVELPYAPEYNVRYG